MHQYLKSIGFGNIRDKKQLIQIIRDVEESYTGHQLVTQDEVTDLCEFDKEYGEGIGIKVCGDMDIDEQFDYRYYAPYFTGSGVTSYANVSVERRIDREAYVGICEDTKVGINLVFYLQNMMEYLRERQIGGRSIKYSSVTLSGLCNEGTILLPVRKSKEQEREQQEEEHNRMLLLSAARTGDPQAIESLTLDDMDTRWMIEFSVLRPSTAYGSPGDEMRLFLTEDGYQAALQSQQRREIKIKRYARVIEGHILDFKPGKRRRS